MTASSVLLDTEVSAYECELAAHLKVKHVVAVSSGTAALHTGLDAVGVRPGDEVLVPALAVVMSVAPIVHLGARPVFVDCNPGGTDFDYDDLSRKTTGHASAVLPVYLWGRAGDPTRLRRFADNQAMAVVADACQALGTTVNGAQAGTEATVGCFSTHHLKLLSTGEGGFVTTNDDDIAARARAYRGHWLTPPPGQQPLTRLAHNFRLADALAAIGRRELACIEALFQQRIKQTALLLELLADVPQLQPAQISANQQWNAYAPLWQLQLPQPRQFSRHLAKLGVPNSTGTFNLVPLDQRPMFASDTPPCTTTAEVLDGILAVVLTRQDDDRRIRRYAETITREVARWVNV